MRKIILHGFNFEIVETLRQCHSIFWIAADDRADIKYSEIRDDISLKATIDFKIIEEAITYISRTSNVIYECYHRHHYLSSMDGSGLSVQDYFSMLISHTCTFLSVFEKFQPNLVIFSNFPHEGYDNVLNQVAKFKGIQTKFFFQVPFSPKHWICNNSLSDSIKPAPNRAEVDACMKDIYLENYIKQALGEDRLPYMYDLRPYNINLFKISYFRSFLKRVSFSQKKFRSSVYCLASDLKNAFLYKKYQVRLSSIISETEMIEEKQFGYFALHMQPELTTSVLGREIYFNQVVAIKIFAEFCENMKLVCLVKENPKQNFSHRSRLFFNSLLSIPNVKLLGGEKDTHDLISQSSVVGTITGTVGIEALLKRKPVICFGDAWWSSLPGVFLPKDLDRFVFHEPPEVSLVKQNIASVYATALNGCSDNDYLSNWSLSISDNNSLILKSITQVIEHS